MDFDAAEVIGLIASASLCDDCLARKTGLLPRRVSDVLIEIAHTIKLTTKPGRCDSCLKQTVVHRLG